MIKKLIIGLCSLCLLIVAGFVIKEYVLQDDSEVIVDLDNLDLELFPRVMNYHEARPILIINGIDVASMTRNEQRIVIKDALYKQKARIITASVGPEEYDFTRTLDTLGLDLEHDMEAILDDIEDKIMYLKTRSAFDLRLPIIFDLAFTYSEEKVQTWVNGVAWWVDEAPIEPTLEMRSRGNFTQVAGKTGRYLDQIQFRNDITATFQDITHSELSITLNTNTAQPTRDTSSFNTINTVVAQATSSFAGSEAGRAGNIKRGAELISGTVLMPGDLFSFNELVGPVNAENGYFPGVAIVGGAFTPGIYGFFIL